MVGRRFLAGFAFLPGPGVAVEPIVKGCRAHTAHTFFGGVADVSLFGAFEDHLFFSFFFRVF